MTLLLLLSVLVMSALFSERVQRISPYPPEMREMTGELGANEGEPVDAIMWDRTDVLAERDGLVYVNAERDYVLQKRTFLWMAAGTWAASMGLISLAALLSRFRRKSP